MMPTIRIDIEVWRCLQGKATPFVDTPNDVLRRVFGLVHEPPTVSATPAAAPAFKAITNTLPAEIASITVVVNAEGKKIKAGTIFGQLMALASKPITMENLLVQGTASINLPHSKKDKQWVLRSYVRDALLRFKYLDRVA